MAAGDTVQHTPNESTKCQMKAYWQLLAERNQWALINDVNAWLDEIIASLGANDQPSHSTVDIKTVLFRAYSARLYSGLLNREERAATELWLICYRQSMKEGRQRGDAEELAQEAVARVLAKLPALRSPESLVSYTLMILRTVFRDHRSQTASTETSLDTLVATSMDIEDRDANLADEVEQKILSTELMEWLRSKIPNTLERLVLIRILLLGDHPRDVARDLNLPLHRTRLAKSRALQRLRGDDDFIQLLLEVAHET